MSLANCNVLLLQKTWRSSKERKKKKRKRKQRGGERRSRRSVALPYTWDFRKDGYFCENPSKPTSDSRWCRPVEIALLAHTLRHLLQMKTFALIFSRKPLAACCMRSAVMKILKTFASTSVLSAQ